MKNKLTIKIDADSTEALKQMKDLTEAANECVAAFERLEKKIGNFKIEPVIFRPVEREYLQSKPLGVTRKWI